jgi:hypothetical protein
MADTVMIEVGRVSGNQEIELEYGREKAEGELRYIPLYERISRMKYIDI